MKNKHSGDCFLCAKYVPRGKGFILKEVIPKLVCAKCYKQNGYAEVNTKKKEAKQKKEKYIQSMWWNQ